MTCPACTATRSAPTWSASGALTRVLMLTASGTVADRVEGLQLGADDYLPKPFAFDELVARVQALGRRATPAAPPVLELGRPGARPGPPGGHPRPACRWT